MNRQLLNFALWAIVLLLLAVFTFFPYLVGPPAPQPPPRNDADWVVQLLFSWSPFIIMIGVWFLLLWWMRRGGAGMLFGRAGWAPMPSDAMLDDPVYWRGRADAARALAERLADLQSKRRMLEIAGGYAYLAQRAEERRRGPDDPA